jgi:hypothetical protein
MRTSLILAAVILSGCASPSFEDWAKPDGTMQEFATAAYQCERDAKLVRAGTWTSFYERCMAAHGWAKR